MTSPNKSATVSPVDALEIDEIDALLYGDKWGGSAGSGASLSYSFPWSNGADAVFEGAGGGSYSRLDEPNAALHYSLNPVQQAAARGALQAWANVADITFTELTESVSDVGDVRFGWTSASHATSTGEAAWGWANYPGSTYPMAGDVWLSTESSGAAAGGSWEVGSYNFRALMHEVGHALGLKHPFEDGVTLDEDMDNTLFSLMSYTEAPNSMLVDVTVSGNSASWQARHVSPDTPMLLDIMAIQYLYGANMHYRTGNDTYTFDPDRPFFSTIWDAGGDDTISVANFSTSCEIDLREVSYSSISGTLPAPAEDIHWTNPPPESTYDGSYNLGIALGAVIENAIGGSGSDILTGNDVANRLQGNEGYNVIDGGAGIDTAVYTGNYRSYALTVSADGNVVGLRGAALSDTLKNIERLSFADATVALGVAGLATDPLQAQYTALAQKFYVAYFGRPADPVGLQSMVAQLTAAAAPTGTGDFLAAYHTNPGVKAIINSFGDSAESAALYGNGSTADFVRAIYSHVLSRAPLEAGLTFWVSALETGGLARGLAALSVMQAAETNSTAQGLLDAALVANHVTVAGNFTAVLDTSLEITSYAGKAAAAAARGLLDAVHSDTSVFTYEANVLSTVDAMVSAHGAMVPQVQLVGNGVLDPAWPLG